MLAVHFNEIDQPANTAWHLIFTVTDPGSITLFDPTEDRSYRFLSLGSFDEKPSMRYIMTSNDDKVRRVVRVVVEFVVSLIDRLIVMMIARKYSSPGSERSRFACVCCRETSYVILSCWGKQKATKHSDGPTYWDVVSCWQLAILDKVHHQFDGLLWHTAVRLLHFDLRNYISLISFVASSIKLTTRIHVWSMSQVSKQRHKWKVCFFHYHILPSIPIHESITIHYHPLPSITRLIFSGINPTYCRPRVRTRPCGVWTYACLCLVWICRTRYQISMFPHCGA